jgi:phage tail-like protein
MSRELEFLYLNLENRWPRFQLTGLVQRPDGALTLARVPQAESTLVELQVPVEALSGPAGIGVDADGNLYVADRANHQILRVDACDGQSAPLPCLSGPGHHPGQLNGPRGLLVGPRHALYVADSGNHRVQVIDLNTQQIRGIWGQPQPYGVPEPGDAPGRLDEPWDLAADRAGHLYVVDHGNHRLQKFDADGRVLAGFWETMRAEPTVPGEPTYIAVAIMDDAERLLVIDGAESRLLIYRPDGTYDAEATSVWEALTLAQPAGLLYSGDTLYIGDAESERLWAFGADGLLIGPVRGYHGPVAGLSLDRRGRLLVHPGNGGAVKRLLPGQAYVETGSFLAGPIAVHARATGWHRLQVLADTLPETAHVRLYTYASSTTASPPPLPEGAQSSPSGPELTPLDTWRVAPTDALDIRVLNEPGRYLWLGGIVRAHGTTSPVLHQMRLEYAYQGWIHHLPSIYQRQDGGEPTFLERALALFESLLSDEEAWIDALPRLFDPWAAPHDQAPSSWLDWLAGWLAFELDEAWSEERQRQALAEAFALYGQRGTVEGLRRMIALYTGGTAHITEPARLASLWSLGETSMLGFTTMLAPAHAQGAVVGTTATLDQSHLIDEEDYGAPLFEDIAHRFCVQVYAAELKDRGAMTKMHQLLQREKPAHTTYHLCFIEPRLRVGFQATVGVDTIVAGPPPELILTEPRQLGLDTATAESPGRRGLGSTVGQDAQIGLRTRLT